MNINELRETLISIFEEMGIIVDAEEDFDIQEYIIDSVVYMSFIVSMEQKLGCEIPDEFLVVSKMGSFYAYCDSLLELIGERK